MNKIGSQERGEDCPDQQHRLVAEGGNRVKEVRRRFETFINQVQQPRSQQNFKWTRPFDAWSVRSLPSARSCILRPPKKLIQHKRAGRWGRQVGQPLVPREFA